MDDRGQTALRGDGGEGVGVVFLTVVLLEKEKGTVRAFRGSGRHARKWSMKGNVLQ